MSLFTYSIAFDRGVLLELPTYGTAAANFGLLLFDCGETFD